MILRLPTYSWCCGVNSQPLSARRHHLHQDTLFYHRPQRNGVRRQDFALWYDLKYPGWGVTI